MKRFKLIATDIDGTLLNDRGELSPVTVRALQTLLQKGTSVVLVTGLNPWTASRYIRQLDTPSGAPLRVISFNGVFQIEEGKIREGKFVPLDVARQAAEMMVHHGYVPLAYGADGVERYVPAPAGMPALRRLMEERAYQPFVAVENVDALFATRPAVVSVCDDDARGRLLHTLLDEALGARAYVVYQPLATRTWIEVNHPAARKDVALLALAGRLGVEPEHILYFGDSLNDIPVFQVVPHCVAVGNARDEVKALAWRVAPTNNDYGVARMLAKLGLVET